VRVWTVTAAAVLSYDEFCKRWAVLSAGLVKRGFIGVRVFEAHPGGHGLHCHVVTAQYWRVEVVRRLAKRAGLGRVHVATHASKKASEYVLKDLGKLRRSGGLKGRRLWAALGKSESHLKVREVRTDGTLIRRFRSLWSQVCPSVRAMRGAALLVMQRADDWYWRERSPTAAAPA